MRKWWVELGKEGGGDLNEFYWEKGLGAFTRIILQARKRIGEEVREASLLMVATKRDPTHVLSGERISSGFSPLKIPAPLLEMGLTTISPGRPARLEGKIFGTKGGHAGRRGVDTADENTPVGKIDASASLDEAHPKGGGSPLGVSVPHALEEHCFGSSASIAARG